MYSLLAATILTLSQPGAPAAFTTAQPVWPADRAEEMNLFVGFHAAVEPEPGSAPVLRITASTLYRVWANGQFIGHGPTRGPHGHYRVDEWAVEPPADDGPLVVAIETAGYNANSYYVLDQPSFVQAEVVATGGAVLAATGHSESPFTAYVLDERVQKVQRYSFQRPFIEVYRLTPGVSAWRTAPEPGRAAVACVVQPEKTLLDRGVPYPDFHIVPATKVVMEGTIRRVPKVERLWKDRSLTNIGPELKGYPEDELELVISNALQHLQTAEKQTISGALSPGDTLELPRNACKVVDFGQNLSGFPRFTVTCETPVRLYATFDEILMDGDVNWRRLGCVNALTFELEPGTYHLEAFEPYTLRYLKLIARKGACTVSDMGLRTYENPDTDRAEFACSDGRLNTLFEAGRATFVQNAVDIFMDCPHRERAGWLCDSFFTARSEMALCGRPAVERNFIRNFLLPDTFAHLPEGMLPMCYPADHYNGVFIPNWALWFVVQLPEYLERSGDQATVAALEGRVMALFDYFKAFENSDGLLEKLESWVFVEWSKANDFVQDVNYPSNMLYAAALDAAAQLYGREALAEQAREIRATVRQQSFDGEFFVDNALREGDTLKVTDNHSEVCQYFAFYFGVASPETHPELWKKLIGAFGPDRSETGAYEQVHPANSFIGNMLRAELLSRHGLSQQLLDESIGYLLYMAKRTGTLWENIHDHASLNHGFASHIVHTLQRDVLGMYRIDPIEKKVVLRFAPLELAWCRGTVPAGDAALRLEWRRQGDTLRYTLNVPDGFTVEIENNTSLELVAAEAR